MQITMRVVSLVMALGASLGLVGCLITYDPDSVDFQGGGSTEPSVTVDQPQPNAEIGDFLDVTLAVRNINLVQKVGQPNVPGEAHLAVFIDGASITPEDQGIVTTSFRINVTSLNHDAGNVHTLRVETRNNDGTPFEGVGPVTVEFTKLPPS
jgi:hypothetical protein